jgi:hypothetical protein
MIVKKIFGIIMGLLMFFCLASTNCAAKTLEEAKQEIQYRERYTPESKYDFIYNGLTGKDKYTIYYVDKGSIHRDANGYVWLRIRLRYSPPLNNNQVADDRVLEFDMQKHQIVIRSSAKMFLSGPVQMETFATAPFQPIPAQSVGELIFKYLKQKGY